MFIKIFHRLIIAFSLLILCYTFYKSEIHWQGTLRNKYLFYYILSFILIFFSIILFFLSKEIKIYITIIFLSILFTVYSYEGYLVLKENNIENFKKKLFLSKTGMKFDTRKLDEVYKDLKKIDNNIVFKSYPKWSLNDDNKEYFPLSGKSLSKTIFCNENGYYSIYESDRYGFNNPDTEWDANKIEYLLLGDSFTHGACVNRPNDIASVLRKLSGSSAINLGMRGNGPLIELASLKEYLTNNTKKIIWIYFEGNDLTDLKYELENKLLLKYLSDDEFRQNLSSKQSLIDQNIVINLPKDNLPSILNNRFFDFLKLNKLRYKILIFYRISSRDVMDSKEKEMILIEFEKILDIANNLAIKNNSKLYFVYLPYILRYQNKLNTNSSNFDTQDYFKVKNIVKNLEIPLIDVHEELFSKNENMLDYLPFNDTSLHLTSEGYKIIAELIFELTSQK